MLASTLKVWVASSLRLILASRYQDKLGKLARPLARSGQDLARYGQDLARMWPGLARSGQVWPGQGPGLARSGQVWPGLARIWPGLARIWPGSGQVWPGPGRSPGGVLGGGPKIWFSAPFRYDFLAIFGLGTQKLRHFGRFLASKNRVGTFLEKSKNPGTLRQKAGSLRS